MVGLIEQPNVNEPALEGPKALRGLMRRPSSARVSVTIANLSLLLVTCSSCIESEHPASSVDTATVDKELIGYWVTTTAAVSPIASESREPQQAYLTIGKSDLPHAPEGLMVETLTSFKQDGVLEVDVRAFFVTRLGGTSYLNLEKGLYGHKPAENPGYGIMKYTVADDTLSLFMPDQVFLRHEIKAGRIAGRVQGEDVENDWVHANITDTTENLANWLSKNEARLFTKPFSVYKRVKTP